MPLGFGHQSLHQPATSALTLRSRAHGDRTNLGQVRAVKVQRAAADDAAFVFQNHEVSTFSQISASVRGSKVPSPGIGGDQLVDVLGIRQNGFTRAHGPPRAGTRFSFSPRQFPAARGRARFRQQHRGSPAPRPASGSRKNPSSNAGFKALQLIERQILKLTILFQAKLHRFANLLVRQAAKERRA
jgi:hypothetical protein